MSDHWSNCWELESHPACRLQRIRELERELATRKTPVLTGTHATYIPCGKFFTHHGDEPPSATL